VANAVKLHQWKVFLMLR